MRSASAEWVLRGPDLDPPASAVRTVRIRYRWSPAPALPPGSTTGTAVTAYFEAPGAAPSRFQPAAVATMSANAEWVVLDLVRRGNRSDLEVRYVYFHGLGWDGGVLDLDAIELVQP